jgi:hypothetical protein
MNIIKNIFLSLILVVVILMIAVMLLLPFEVLQNEREIWWFIKLITGSLLFGWLLTIPITFYSAIAGIYDFEPKLLPNYSEDKDWIKKTLKKKSIAIFLGFASYFYSIYIFALAYFYLSERWTGSFKEDRKMDAISALYFSVVTISTVGYGDITPMGSLCKFLVMVEILLGNLFTILIFSSLVSFISKKSNTISSN